MEPFGSFPAVLGHEILAQVEEVGPGVTRVRPGQRIAVDPILSCTARGHDRPCPSCAGGLHSTCEMAGEDGETRVDGKPMSAGLTMGYHRDLPGGWGERIVAHEDQAFPVPDGLSDRAAVLTEPLSIGMHAVLRSPPQPDAEVLVIGSGPIALGTVWALRASGFDGVIVAQAKRRHEADLAMALGASEVIKPGDEARDAMVRTGAQAYQPIIGPEVFSGGGFPLIFDCVGSPSSLHQALTFASPRGEIVMLGCAAEIPKLDLTFVWARELNIRGYVGYGLEEWRGERLHTFEVTHRLMVEGGAPVHDLVTHVFPLHQYRDALSAAANHRRSRAVKVVLQP
jgi:threonine dehydrogenase-like Zn-dependent dehydrogenase